MPSDDRVRGRESQPANAEFGVKTRPGNFFEDFRLGEKIRHATPRTITDGDCSLYIALTGSRHILHCARPVAHALGFRDRTVDDLLAFHIAFGKTVPDISLNAVANLGYADVRFCAPCYPGDTLRAESEIIGLKQNASGKSGIVWVRSSAFNQNGERVLSWARWVMVHKRNAEAPAPKTVIPDLPQVVPVERLNIPAFLNAARFEPETTGSTDLWDDYAVGERIDHPAGMTVDESDHTLATRLYQNTARVHFDALAMKDSQFGRRLMYGGHVISVCRALAYDGLENAISIAAINAGSHVNPAFAGDTLYAYTQVLEKWALPGRDDLGALRLRLTGAKNRRASEISASTGADGKHDPHVVLDLDYTVLMPRRGKT
jgi:2-methylfumaryl-CoA hydratase